MKTHYGQITNAYMRAAFISAALLAVFGGAFLLTDGIYAGIAALVMAAVVFICVWRLHSRRKSMVRMYLSLISKDAGVMSSNLISALPLPVAVSHIDGTVRWYNERFLRIFGGAELFEKRVETLIPEVKWSTVLKSPEAYEKHVEIGESVFSLVAAPVRNKHADGEDKVSVYIYLIDKTTETKLKDLYENEKTDVAVINIDNYDDVIQRVNDNERQQILSYIRRCVNEWGAESQALVKNTDRDRYYVMFEHGHLAQYEKNKFDILNKVRKIGEERKLPISISIGIGIGGTLSENDSYARSALDIALGRGGDQVSIKDEVQYRFFGGKARDYEKSTRVKTRAFAAALKDFIKSSDNVIFMGHSGADYDCFGAAMGLQRAVRALGKRPYIIHDGNSPAIRVLYDEFRQMPEYDGMFIDGGRALEILTENTLVVVLDTHRPSMLPCQPLVKNAAKVILIDHHRRSTDFLSPCSLIYHEPYASSTCEMATELMEYMDLGSSLTKREAEALYTGILMDTKNFMVKTGVRTFDAASYLRRLGLNTADIKKLFNVSKEDYIRRSEIVAATEIIAPHIAVAMTYKVIPNIRVIASMASDEMLNIGSIRASIVVYPQEGSVGVSARSLGDINVQLIMEKLGGGGHSTVAGAQVRNKNVDMVIDDVKNAVRDYLQNEEI